MRYSGNAVQSRSTEKLDASEKGNPKTRIVKMIVSYLLFVILLGEG